jgi:N-acetylneuraminate synthase
LARGANLIEAHIVLDRQMFGPDVAASLTTEEFRTVTQARDAFWKMQNSPVHKDALAQELTRERSLFGKSAALTRSLGAGTKLEREMLTLKKPGDGIPEEDFEQLVGRTLKTDVSHERLLRWDDVE